MTTATHIIVGAVPSFGTTRAAAAALTIPASVSVVHTGGYYAAGDGGGAEFKRVAGPLTDTASFQSADGGWWLITNTVINPRQFGVKGIGVSFDDTTFFQSMRDFVADNLTAVELDTINIHYTVSPNWAIEGLNVTSVGETQFTYSGTENALVFDADAADAVCAVAGLCYNITFCFDNPVRVNCPSTAKAAIFRRSIHHSRLGYNARGAGTTYAGEHVKFGVCNTIRYICSVNQGGWYGSAKPAYGILHEIRNAGETVSYDTYINPVVEGPDIGRQSTGSLGCVFLGGTFEACTTYGHYGNTGASQDTYIGTDFEANTTADVYHLGNNLSLIDCDTDTQVAFGATSKSCQITGGVHVKILIDVGANGCGARDVIYDRHNTGVTFTDAGTATELMNVRRGDTNRSMYLTAVVAYAGASIATTATATKTFAMTGLKTTDMLIVGCDSSLAGFLISAVVTSAGNGQIVITNTTAGTIVVPACNFYVRALRGLA